MGAILVARVFYYICYRYPLYCYWGFGDLSERYPLREKKGHQCAKSSKALVVEHSLRAIAAAIRDRKGEGSLRPPGCPPGGLRAFIGSLAPMAQRAINKGADSETADADSQPYAPDPGGEYYSEARLPRGSSTASAPRHNIMYRIA